METGADASDSGTVDTFLRAAARVSDVPLGATEQLAAGTVLGSGRFEIRRLLGAGGMGVVYEAYDRHRRCSVALKTLRAVTLEAMRRLRSEFLALHDLVHPSLVTLGELLDDGGVTYFTMELVDGVDFLTHVRPGGVLDLARLRSALHELVGGLLFLHAAGTVHRDVKPSNVLVTVQDGHRVVVLDFGLAVSADHHAVDTGGTIAYMAPEQAESARVSAAADWYAVGIMLWEALTGSLPFTGSAGAVLAAKHRGPPPEALGPADLVALATALLDPDPARRPSGEVVARALGITTPAGPSRTPFVGRGAELAALDEAWRASRERVITVVLRGPSGVGKSALVQHFAGGLARDQGAVVAAGRCYERMAVSYKAIHGVAAALARHLRDDRDDRDAVLATPDVGLVASVLPPFAEVDELLRAALDAPRLRDPQQLRARLFDAFRTLIRTLAARRPFALLVDDLQWADRDGLRLLEHVAAGDGAPFLLLVAARDDARFDETRWLIEAVQVRLGPLAPADAEDLAHALVRDGVSAAAIAREADGHPLYIAELARHRFDAGYDGEPRRAALRLDEAIGSRVAALPSAPAHLLELVSLTGAPLPQRLVRDAAALDGAAFWSALGVLRAAHLIRTHGPDGDDAVEPYHDRVRESVVARLSAEERRDHHVRLASALAPDPLAEANPGLLADQLEAAGDHAGAATWTERAADRAAAALAFERAAELYQRALDLGGIAGDNAETASLRVRLGEALANAGRGAPAAGAYLDAARTVSPDHALDLRRRAAEQLLRSGHVEPGLVTLDGVLREVGLPTASSRRWQIASLLWQRALVRLRLLRAPSRPTHRVGDARRLACCWTTVVGLSMISLGSFEYLARHLRLALAAGDQRQIALGLAYEAVGAAAAGPPARRAHALLAEAGRRACELDEPMGHAYVAMAQGAVAFLCARWREAQERCDVAERILREECVGAAWEIGTAQRISLICLWHLGRFGELRRRVLHAIADAEARGDRYTLIQLRTVQHPNVLMTEDRPDAARDELARIGDELAQQPMRVQHWQHMQATAMVALYSGDPVTAVRHIETRLPAARRAFVLHVKLIRAMTYFVRGNSYAAAAALGGPEAARWTRRAAQDVRRVRRIGGIPAAADLLAAQLALLEGDRPRAGRLFAAAADGFATVDMGLCSAAARWRCDQLARDDAGAAAIEASLAAEGVVRPQRMLAMMAPVAP